MIAEGPDVADLQRRVAQLKEERDYLLAHSRNLEVELRRAALQSGAVRDLEERLADAEARLRRVSLVHSARWLLLDPEGALRSVYRRFRDGVWWRAGERVRVLRLKLRRIRA
jgi:hypothetical protein